MGVRTIPQRTMRKVSLGQSHWDSPSSKKKHLAVKRTLQKRTDCCFGHTSRMLLASAVHLLFGGTINACISLVVRFQEPFAPLFRHTFSTLAARELFALTANPVDFSTCCKSSTCASSHLRPTIQTWRVLTIFTSETVSLL